MAKVAIIYYSSTGNVHRLAHAIEQGASGAGAQTRLRHVEELASEDAIAQNQAWAAHRDEVKDDPVASLDELEWADARTLTAARSRRCWRSTPRSTTGGRSS